MALRSTSTLRHAKSALGVARKAEKRAIAAAQADATRSTRDAVRTASERASSAVTDYEVERALVALRAITGPTSPDHRRRLFEGVQATGAGQLS